VKLTNHHRQDFVAAAMQDVPKIDFYSQFKELVTKDMIDVAPKKLSAVLAEESLRHHVISPYCTEGGYNDPLGTVAVFANYKMSDHAKVKRAALTKLARAQKDERETFEAQLRGAIAGCNTLKVALVRLPEFAKYLPKEAEKTVYLPAISNLVANLTKAGWPAAKTSGLVTA